MTLPRILTSSKFQASFVGTLLLAIPFIFTETDRNLDRVHKQDAATAFTIAVAGLWGISIGGTAHEDAAKASGPSSSPDVQVNTGAAAQNTQTPAPLAVAPKASPAIGIGMPLGPTMTRTVPPRKPVAYQPPKA